MTGFTLLELMIVTAVVAILASIAYPSYTAYVARARRAEAKAILLDAASWLERQYALNGNSYAVGSAALANAGYDKSPRSGTAYYLLDFAAAPTATDFTLRASVNTDAWSEPLCTTLTLDARGERGATGSAGPDLCWKK